MDITPKTPWKERRIKSGSFLDRKLSADILKVRRQHDSNIREIEKNTEYSAFMVAICLLGALLLMVVFCRVSHAEDINLDIIADIESGGNPLAVNGGHVGEYQISQGVITTYNEETKYASTYFPITLEDMYIPLYAHDMAEWFINRKIPSWLNYYGIPDTTTNRIIATFWTQEFPVNMDIRNIPEHKLKEFVITKF